MEVRPSIDKTFTIVTEIVKGNGLRWGECVRRACLEELVEVMQQRFNELVTEQLETMDKLLYLQSEIERCQELEKELIELQEMTRVECLQQEILSKKKELREIQQMFQRQTDEVILSYQKEQSSVTT